MRTYHKVDYGNHIIGGGDFLEITYKYYQTKSNYVAVGYQLLIVGNEALGGWIGAFVVLNPKGDIIARDDSIDISVFEISITENGRFLAYTVPIGEIGETTYGPEYRIYDTKYKKYIEQGTLPTTFYYNWGTIAFEDNILCITGSGSSRHFITVYVYNKGSIYSKTYTEKETWKFPTITSDSIVLIRPDYSRRTEYYLKDFVIIGKYEE